MNFSPLICIINDVSNLHRIVFAMKILVFLFLMFTTAAYAGLETDTDTDTYPNEHLLVEVDDLRMLMQQANVVLVDMREDGFNEGHIPGAVWFGGIPALVDSSHEVEHFLVSPSEFQQIMRTIGVNSDSQVLIYDHGNGLGASRLYYALSLYGHENAAVVNGGIAAWKAAELPLEQDGDIPVPGNFTSKVDESRACDVRFITENLERDDLVILDARSADEHTGKEKRSERVGHIPGAVNLEWQNFIQEGDIPFFKSASEIADMLAERGITPDKEVITHCQTNVRGSHAFFTMRLMGYDSVRAYEGSWFEWGNRADTPVSGE